MCAFAMLSFDWELAPGQCLRKPWSSFLILQLYAFHSRPGTQIFLSKLACLYGSKMLFLPQCYSHGYTGTSLSSTPVFHPYPYHPACAQQPGR